MSIDGVNAKNQLTTSRTCELSHKMLYMNSFCVALVLVLLFGVSHAEFYSSIHEMSKVLGYEQKMLLHVQRFIDENLSKLDFLRA